MKLKIPTLTLFALALAAGCQRESGDAKGPKPAVRRTAPVAVQRGPTAEELTAGMVEAATQGKSQAPVGLKFDVSRRPVQGEPLEISIALIPREAAEPATVDVIGPEGLEVPAEERRFEFASVEPSQVYRRSIRLTPTAEGVFLLTLTVNLKHDQLADTRVFSVPLIVTAEVSEKASAKTSANTLGNAPANISATASGGLAPAQASSGNSLAMPTASPRS
jgi:hypothetical protein